ncbi:VOC family protein [Alistipes sp. ZOR0009]|jgi:predicted enzyme related to lactoylglutathione lyase|uniref:VOC family protein n=1 Tax=Alistipes sp. ZOR0009 TaxID=1339253 RepID=UPI000645AEA0|nr:VOC family protein [Alistipes sp. ZOR0009]
MEKLVSWVDIPAANFERAVAFYRGILNIDFNISVHANEKMACFPTGEGAISYSPGFNPSADGTLVSLNTGDHLDATIERIVALGGTITQPKTKIEVEGLGYFALFTDSEGNRVGLYGNR